MASKITPTRGEVWDVDLDPVEGHEQRGRRPAIVVSVDQINRKGSELVVVVPVTKTNRVIRTHVTIRSGEGGLDTESYALVEHIRSVSHDRLKAKRGAVTAATMSEIGRVLRFVLGV